MAQDRLLQPAQLGSRLHAERLHELLARRAVDLERLDLAAGPVESEHQQLPQPLAQRVLGREVAQLGHRRGVAGQRQLGFEAVLEGREPQLLETRDRGLGERLVLEVGQRRAAPQGEGLAQHRQRGTRIGAERVRGLAR